MFKSDYLLKSLLVRGEVSNCKYHSSGHIYFTLKDEKGAISCIMFASKRNGLDFTLKEGQQVILHGTVDVFVRDGKYQIYAEEILLDGQGDLHEKYEKLKEELEEMGMFDQTYKQNIPRYIERLGVVTAQTGAAIQDIIQIVTRRNPYVQIILYPAIVQGEQAVPSIVEGIRQLEASKVDTLIVGRGGGSIEDLWAFNEREVVQAIFDCRIPIISAVGHETDTTLADYVADLRAPTPSAAAELAVYDYEELEERLDSYRIMVTRGIKRKLDMTRQEVERRKFRLVQISPTNRLREQKMYMLRLEELLDTKMKQVLTDKQHALSILIERMKGLSPLEKLGQGYGYLSSKDGQAMKDIKQVSVGDEVCIHMVNGEIEAKVLKKKSVKRG